MMDCRFEKLSEADKARYEKEIAESVSCCSSQCVGKSVFSAELGDKEVNI